MGTRPTQINMRISEPQRDLIDRAADSLGVSRTQFILDAARDRAEERLAEERVFRLDKASFEALQAVLDAPVVVPEGLRDLMSHRPPWER